MVQLVVEQISITESLGNSRLGNQVISADREKKIKLKKKEKNSFFIVHLSLFLNGVH
jgi:hypothetical protein